MERALSAEERIKRAEEIYQRRKMQNGVRVSTRNVNTREKTEYSLLKKMIIQILVCLLVYLIFYLIHNSNYIFSENVISKTREFLSYDINFQEVFNNIGQFYNDNISVLLKNNKEEIKDKNEQKNENTSEQKDSNEQVKTEDKKEEKENNVINEQESEKVQVVSENEEKKELTQMEIDAQYIKANYSLIRPLNGVISSRFGPREATEIISANHEGIDIAADEGTVFIASMEGTVTDVIDEGGYGNHIYIQNGDVITLYAHCNKIYLNEGDTVSQGDEIGEVGQTGNATGPHLHFEVRREDRVIDPEYILDF